MRVQEIFGRSDVDPLPIGTRVGDLIHASRITGVDPETGQLGQDAEQQMALIYPGLRQDGFAIHFEAVEFEDLQ